MKALVTVCALGFLLSIAGARADEEAPPPAQRLPAPEHLSSETRAELHARMGRHGETISSLVRAVVLLDRPTIRTLAGRIADEEVVAQTKAASKERKRLSLPPEFFTEQTALGVVARELAAAASEDGDDKALADRFSALTRTCVGCHSIYLHGRPELRPVGPR